MRVKLILTIAALSLITSCMPDAPHNWMIGERRHIEYQCPLIKDDGGRINNVRHNAYWSCHKPHSFSEWEQKFVNSMIARGWRTVQSSDDWKSMCHNDTNRVLLRYGVYAEGKTNQQYLGIRLMFPATECSIDNK